MGDAGIVSTPRYAGLEAGISEVNTSRLDLLLTSFGYETNNAILETLLNSPPESLQPNAVGVHREQKGIPPSWADVWVWASSSSIYSQTCRLNALCTIQLPLSKTSDSFSQAIYMQFQDKHLRAC